MNVFAGTQIHEGITSPNHTPLQFLDFFFDRRSDCRVSNIGIDFDLEHASNNLRFQFFVMNVGANNGTTTGHFTANKFGFNTFPDGTIQHFFGNHALFGKVHLRHAGMIFGGALVNPFLTNFGCAFQGIDIHGTRCVIDIQIRLIGIFEMNTSKWNLQDMSCRFVNDGRVFLGAAGKGFMIGDTFNAFKFGTKGIFGRNGAFGLGFLDRGGFFEIFFQDKPSRQSTTLRGQDKSRCRRDQGESRYQELHLGVF